MTPELLREILHYCPDSGEFTWLVDIKRVNAGDKAGCVRSGGYICIQYNGKVYRAHRLAYLYMTGEWPKELLDHANNIKTDNRWCNLRPATRSENNRNCKVYKNNKSGLKGVRSAKDGKFDARIAVNKKQRHLGRFNTAQEAHEAYCEAANRLHGDFARHG